MTDILVQAIEAVLVPTIPIVGAYVVKFLDAHVGQKNTEQLERTAFNVVQAVEQMADANHIDKTSKLGTALSTLEELFPKQSETTIRQYVESSVAQVNRMKGWQIAEPIKAAPVADTEQQI